MFPDVPNTFGYDKSMESPQRLLSRHKREFTWDDVEEFYDDKNNLAMYLVLPIIVIVYGGCAVIYCIARCRRYIKRKKKKSKADDQAFFENEPLDGDDNGSQRHPSIPVISSSQNGGNAMPRDGAQTSSEVSLSLDPDSGNETPLPWQVPGEKQLYPSVGATSKAYSNKGYENDCLTPVLPPPSYEDPFSKRPDSKPPPYEEKSNRVRRGSVEEIITLEQTPMPTNDRKRRHQGSRPSSSAATGDDKGKYEEERERARQLVRGNRERKELPPLDRINRERTPDIISHARTQPLQPSYRPPRDDAQMDASLMAKQAAQLLRLDHMGKTQGKKQKRLVFVAE